MIAIYKITNTTNGKFYIGSSGNYRKRLQKWRDWRNSASNPKLIHDFQTIGFDKFVFEVIKELPPGTTRRERERMEYDLIHELQPFYNTIGKERPPDVRKKLSEANTGKHPTAEQRARRSSALRRRFSECPRDGSCTFKPVLVVETGEKFESVKAVANWLGVQSGYISKRIRNNPNARIKGYHLQYLPKCRD